MADKSKGKQALPYLLSTTKTLARCKHYYYRGIDFKFNSKRNRDCFSERNVRINMTRMWHNVILPNAILCREYKHPTTFKEAIDALNYAMTHGKTERSLAMWKQICTAESKLPNTEQVVFKYAKGYYYYVEGKGATKDGLLYELPKKKRHTIKTYRDQVVYRFIWHKCKIWECPWDDLNMLIEKYKHYKDEWFARCEARTNEIDDCEVMVKRNSWLGPSDMVDKFKMRLAELEKEDEDDVEPVFPKTVRAICDEFHVSMTSAQRMRCWIKQMNKETDFKYSDDPRNLTWDSVNRNSDDDEQDMLDTETEDSEEINIESSIDHDIESVVNSGERPVGNWDDGAELPF